MPHAPTIRATTSGLLLLTAPVRVFATSLVLPPAYQSTDAPSSQASTLGSGERTLQFVFGTSQLGSLSVGTLLTGLTFRLDPIDPAWPPAGVTWSSYDIQLSKSLNAPGSLSTTFASNIGPDVVTVRSGPLTFAAGAFTAGNTPNAFGPVILFTVPYTYTGGNLLVTIRHTASGVDSPDVDAVTTTPGSYEGLIAASFSASSADGLGTTVPVVQFTTQVSPVPEPATVTLMLGGGSLLLRRARRRR